MIRHEAITVLIVEDSPTQALTLRYVLEKRGYMVRVAENGRIGLESIRTDAPTLVISDIVMPEMDGYTLCREVKEDPLTRDIPVILLTTLSDPVDIIRGLESGADNFLIKPYNEDSLLARIEYILANRRTRSGSASAGEVEVVLGNKRHSLTSERAQILDLLIATYENAVEKNKELEVSNRKLRIAHEELEMKNAELKELNEQKNMLLGMAVHDLRNPLYLIEGYSDYLLTDNDSPIAGEQRSILETIQKNSRFMGSLINDLLDVQKIESGRLELQPRQSRLDQLVEQVIHMLRFSAERKHITIAYQRQENMPEIHLDPARIEQVVSNLLDNAIKYSYPNSTVTIMVQADEKEATVLVSDSGVGIPPDEMEKLFTPFGRTSMRATGGEKSTGLGLAIAKKIVTQHGGTIWASRQRDGGTVFTFSIPRQKQFSTVSVEMEAQG